MLIRLEALGSQRPYPVQFCGGDLINVSPFLADAFGGADVHGAIVVIIKTILKKLKHKCITIMMKKNATA